MRKSGDDDDQLINITERNAEEIKIGDDDEWIISIMADHERQEYSQNDQLKKDQQREQVTMQKVPQELREKKLNKGFFDPRLVPIGPYHREAKPEFEETEKLKSRAVYAFLVDSNREPTVFYDKMFQVVSDARKCYLPGSTDAYDDVAFARMMLLDGCFLLKFMDTQVNRRGPFGEELHKHVGRAGIRAIKSDIILLENQLPFLVLQELISTRRHPDQEEGGNNQWEELIEKFIFHIYIDRKATWTKQSDEHEKEEPPLHFLQLVRRRIIGSNSHTGIITTHHEHQGLASGGGQKPMKDAYSYSFRSATELKSRGIRFRPSTTFFLKDVTFTSCFGYGTLTLPQLSFGYLFKYCFLNMMAYELAPSTKVNSEVCNYMVFMNSLINEADDVIELRSRNIVHNFHGTDEELAKAFNSMARGSVYLSHKGPIKDVNDRLQDHYNSRMKTRIAQLFHDYFSTPWSVIAFFAASFGLVFTFLQTFFPLG